MSKLIGAPQVALLILIPVAIFFLGYYFGKKSGYLKRIKETEAKEISHNNTL